MLVKIQLQGEIINALAKQIYNQQHTRGQVDFCYINLLLERAIAQNKDIESEELRRNKINNDK